MGVGLVGLDGVFEGTENMIACPSVSMLVITTQSC
jgi:hypothetical protein